MAPLQKVINPSAAISAAHKLCEDIISGSLIGSLKAFELSGNFWVAGIGHLTFLPVFRVAHPGPLVQRRPLRVLVLLGQQY
jgi:hypothetical protein